MIIFKTLLLVLAIIIAYSQTKCINPLYDFSTLQNAYYSIVLMTIPIFLWMKTWDFMIGTKHEK